jgi:phosphoglucosamine mutase
VDFDRVLAAYAGYITKKNGHGTVVTNVEASMCVDKMVEANHGEVLRSKVGDVYVSEMMKERKAIFGGEPCGAWIHPAFHFCPDGILSSVLLLRALEDRNQTLSELISETPEYPTLRTNIPFDKKKDCELIEKIKEDMQSIFGSYREVSEIDGIRISLEDGWILVRQSGTEPLIRLTVEGESLKTAQNIMKKGTMLVEQAKRNVK